VTAIGRIASQRGEPGESRQQTQGTWPMEIPFHPSLSFDNACE
jgi:hypothetical protein